MTDVNDINEVHRKFVEKGLPEYMWGGVARYLYEGVPPGDFLQAVITNDLSRAVNYGDETNQACLAAWVKFFYNQCPSGCWGSKEALREWCARGGLNRTG